MSRGLQSSVKTAILVGRREQELQVEERENQYVVGEAQMVGAERQLNSAALRKAAGRRQPSCATKRLVT